MKKYNIIDKTVDVDNFILCQCPTLEIAKKRLEEMKKIDKELKKYYNWKKLPQYEIIESEVK